MTHLPAGYDEAKERAIREAAQVEGLIGPKTRRLLFMLAAGTPADGVILEIGSFKGRSTLVLARAAELTGRRVVTVDPHDAGPLEPGGSSLEVFERNMERAGVGETATPLVMRSEEAAKGWDQQIAFLWVDGDHSYPSAKRDFELFSPFIARNGLVAFHDVLHDFPGPVRVFREAVLLAEEYGPAGVIGSTGWAQRTGRATQRERKRKAELARRLRPLASWTSLVDASRGLGKLWFKLLRSRVPHDELGEGEWLALLRPIG